MISNEPLVTDPLDIDHLTYTTLVHVTKWLLYVKAHEDEKREL
jgi:hypothetical protein